MDKKLALAKIRSAPFELMPTSVIREFVLGIVHEIEEAPPAPKLTPAQRDALCHAIEGHEKAKAAFAKLPLDLRVVFEMHLPKANRTTDALASILRADGAL